MSDCPEMKRMRFEAKRDMTAVIYRYIGRPAKPRTIQIRQRDIWYREKSQTGFLTNDDYPGWRLIMPENVSSFFRKTTQDREVPVSARINPETGLPMLTHSQLVTLASQILRRMGYPYIISEPGFRDELPDAFGMSENMTCLIECKATRADFLADMKKEFRIHPEKGIGRQRIYLVNKGVCTPEELPEGWQMIEALDNHTVITEYGDLKKHWNDRYMFEERNLDSEYRLMCSWAYRREHGCLKDPGPVRIRCMPRNPRATGET